MSFSPRTPKHLWKEIGMAEGRESWQLQSGFKKSSQKPLKNSRTQIAQISDVSSEKVPVDYNKSQRKHESPPTQHRDFQHYENHVHYIGQSNFKFQTDFENEDNEFDKQIRQSAINFIQHAESSGNQILFSLQSKDLKKRKFDKWKELILHIRNIKISHKETQLTLQLFRKKFKQYFEDLQSNFSFQLKKVIENYLLKISLLEEKLKQQTNKEEVFQIKTLYNRKIRQMERQIKDLSEEKQSLNQRIFEAEQRVVQADLEMEERISMIEELVREKEEKSYMKQIHRLQEQIQRLSSNLLKYQHSQTHLQFQRKLKAKQQQLYRKQQEIEDQFEEVARQHTQMQERMDYKEEQLKKLQIKLLNKIQELDQIQHRRVQPKKQNYKVSIPLYNRIKTQEQPVNQQVYSRLSSSRKKKTERIATQNNSYCEVMPINRTFFKTRNEEKSPRDRSSNRLDSLNMQLKRLKQQMNSQMRQQR